MHLRCSAPSFALLLPLAAACGSTPPPVADAPVEKQEEVSHTAHHDAPSIEYDLGSIDPSVAQRRFDTLKSTWNGCFDDAHQKNDTLRGSLSFTIRTNKDGSVKWAYVTSSELGDRSVEKCVIDSVKAQNFGAPMDAREGEIKDKSYGWQIDDDEERPADPGDPSTVLTAIGKAKGKLDDCRKSSTAHFTATIYVAPKGKPRSIGVAIDDPSGDDAIDCVVEVLSKLKYTNNSSWTTKVSVQLP